MATLSATKEETPKVNTTNRNMIGDNRYKLIEATMKRHLYQSDALIEVLHTAQQAFGYLEDDLLLYIAHKLCVPPSRVYGVATFYHFFSLKPQGKHSCTVCLGTACYVKGAQKIVDEIRAVAGIKPGETTPGGEMSLVAARCIGACSIAPAVVIDGVVSGNQSVGPVVNAVKGWLANGPE
jgi:bidirectional [NiFe] hydrogenase diaphorase subunit